METYGDLKKAIEAIKSKQRNVKVGNFAVDVALDFIPGASVAKDTFEFIKSAFNKPDEKKTDSWLDKLDVDDEMSANVDDTVENGFLKMITKTIESESDSKQLEPDFNMNQKMVDYLKKNYEGRTVTGIKESKPDALDRYLNRIAYKFDKGYPDMNNNQDVALLNELLNNLLENEEEEIDIKIDDKEEVETKEKTPLKVPPGGSETYNDTIRYALYW